MAKRELIIAETRRVNRGGKYYDRVLILEDGRRITRYRKWNPKKGNKATRTLQYEQQYKELSTDRRARRFVKDKSRQVRQRSVKQVTTKKKGYYLSTIRFSVIVRYKNQTPFHYPTLGGTSFIERSGNITEESMIRSILGLESGAYQDWTAWRDRFVPGGDVHIFYGWTYKRAFSRSGSFDGDAEYLDFRETRFRGNSSPVKIDRFDKLRKKRRGDNH